MEAFFAKHPHTPTEEHAIEMIICKLESAKEYKHGHPDYFACLQKAHEMLHDLISLYSTDVPHSRSVLHHRV